jgi:Bacterial dnaA protein helix-turn-helix
MPAPSQPMKQTARRIPLSAIDAAVAARLGPGRVAGNAQPAVFSRQVAMYLAKHVGGWSTTRIGQFYSGRDHSTVCYALKRVAALREDDPEVDGLVTSLAGEIKTAAPKENDHADAESRTPAGAQDLRFHDAFLDALADRLAMRLFDRAKGIDASAASSPK